MKDRGANLQAFIIQSTDQLQLGKRRVARRVITNTAPFMETNNPTAFIRGTVCVCVHVRVCVCVCVSLSGESSWEVGWL